MNLSSGDVVIDVGAHIGCFSISVAQRFPQVTVVALEPLPSNFHFLQVSLSHKTSICWVIVLFDELLREQQPTACQRDR